MEVVDLALEGLKLVKPQVFKDSRGFFLESYRESLYFGSGIKSRFIQDNHSFSEKDVIRGMHFQKTPGQDKLVSVVQGKIFDVAVDIRPGSSTFGKWEKVILDDTHCYQFFIPNGFAHGFLVLSPSAHVVYKVSSYFDPLSEKGFIYNDPSVNINWPIANPILSQRDLLAPLLSQVPL